MHLEVHGRVQGVGFRPFVYRLASQAGLTGFVGNNPAGAFIELQGPHTALEQFIEHLQNQLPSVAAITAIDRREIAVQAESSFEIHHTALTGDCRAEIAPDLATCHDCLAELNNPSDRRYRYPFINCTNCGPRYSIVEAVPYDRCHTTMKAFLMCSECRREYDNPADRRFHAQPNACYTCGPNIWLVDSEGRHIAERYDAVVQSARWLEEGRIIAVKGLGGFHLACRADHDQAVMTLRKRKGREAKPLAVMLGSIKSASRYARLDEMIIAILLSRQRPIVLAPRRHLDGISRYVAPDSDSLGLMLPYTPLHTLLFQELGDVPLVMTSGNPSAEPLCARNDEAIERLGYIADAILMHNRDIHRRIDDSVVMAISLDAYEETAEPCNRHDYILPIRRARGYVPEPVRIPFHARQAVIALGGELKSTICLLREDQAVLSEHIGDLDNPAAYRHFIGSIAYLKNLLDFSPQCVAYDLHPAYRSTQYARSLDLTMAAVQHHHAHVVSCMAENGLTGNVIGVACDGTGYGDDDTIWGCEVLVCNEHTYHRAGHLVPFALPGGDAAAKDTWRPAAGLMQLYYGSRWPDTVTRLFDNIDLDAVKLVRQQLDNGADTIVKTSSLGRLFDAAAFVLGVCRFNRYEAESPILLETLANSASHRNLPVLESAMTETEEGVFRMHGGQLLAQLAERAHKLHTGNALARAFHCAVADMIAETVRRVAGRTGLERITLSGGCFANRLLTSRLWRLLTQSGLQVYVHHLVPTGDGGIALGQAVVAAATINQLEESH